MGNRLRGVAQRFGGQGCSQVRLCQHWVYGQGLVESSERLRRVLLLKFELAEFILRHGHARVETGSLLKLFSRGIRLAGLPKRPRVIQVRADILWFKRGSFLQM